MQNTTIIMERKGIRCRLCLNRKGKMINIFKKSDRIMISAKIMCIAKVCIYPEDGLPASICLICLTKLNNCIEFIQLCEASDVKLRKLMSSDIEENSIFIDKNHENVSDDEIKSSSQIDSSKGSNSDSTGACDVNNFVKTVIDSKIALTKNKDRKKYEAEDIKTRQQCNICGRVMSSRHRLKTHLAIHSGERPFACTFCHKNFSLEANLKVHLRVHTGEKPFRCAECGETFAQSSGLITHKRKHTGQLPYKCMLCPRSFRTIGHLQYHTKRHTGEKNFECEKCNRAFITRGDLNQHLATHLGNRTHVCSVCGLRLTRASNLKRHAQLIHGVTSTNRLEGLVLQSTSNLEE